MKILQLALAALITAGSISAAPKAAKKPKNFADLFGKQWTLEKAMVKGKDMTEGLNSKMSGGALVFTFAEDGAMTTTDPEVVAADWKFNEKGLNIHTENKPTLETPAGAKGPQGTIFYQIKKLTADTLMLEIPLMKMVLTFKAK